MIKSRRRLENILNPKILSKNGVKNSDYVATIKSIGAKKFPHRAAIKFSALTECRQKIAPYQNGTGFFVKDKSIAFNQSNLFS